ncbi:hypothetical protein JSE7799_01909 [Jannaschia seosinensis]|uniref:Uncharacterized protein n=1 Tax=Jannaschia seosinensis TaxID=313367 RepID=A0A0M7BD39_9RHOB|nr:hypothetical protein JSE7799_01909 [Jannaschia seosinensis]
MTRSQQNFQTAGCSITTSAASYMSLLSEDAA